MKTLYKFLLVVLMALPLGGQAQCDLRDGDPYNSGSNMLVFLTPNFINSLPISGVGSYLFAVNSSGLLVGKEVVSGVNQAALTIWGDDPTTTEVDGLLADELIQFYLVDEDMLYLIEMPTSVSYTTNTTVPQLSAASYTLDCAPTISGCTDEYSLNFDPNSTLDDGTCLYNCTDQWRPRYTYNTGSNMTSMLTQTFINSLNIQTDDAYLVAITEGGLTVGSADIGNMPTSLAIWSDDSFTPELDGAIDGDDISLMLMDGTRVYSLDTSIKFFTNGVIGIDQVAVLTLECLTEGLPGCMDSSSCNYNYEAEIDDGTCIIPQDCETCSEGIIVDNDSDNDGLCNEVDTLSGCTDNTACNYNNSPTLNTDNTGCVYAINLDACASCSGEQDGTGAIVDNDADDDGVCDADEIVGCMDDTRCNYNVSATDDEGCLPALDGVCETCSGEQNGTGTIVDNDSDHDGVCDADEIVGCMDDTRCNYNVLATDDEGCLPALDGACETCSGEQDGMGTILDNDADDDGICNEDEIVGCMSVWADNYDELATDDAPCYRYGCTSVWADNYDALATDDDDTCIREGCIDSAADNFDSLATNDDASCLYSGCTINTACNYNTTANVDDGSCEFPEVYYDCNDQCLNDTDSDGVCNELEVVGCQQVNANNFNSLATDPGACVYFGCMEVEADNYNPNANTSDGSCYYLGCMSQEALNYDANATKNDESICVYNVADFGCELPDRYSNLLTGSNMNLLFTSDFTSNINIVHSDAFVVGITDSDKIVGSAPIQQGDVVSITLWGDDVGTDLIDGALSWELIRLYIVDGSNLYRLTLNEQLNYSDNKTEILYNFTELTTLCMNGFYTELPIYGCTDALASNYISPIGDPSIDVNTEDGTCLYDGINNCDFPPAYSGKITGNNMNILFTETFMSSLPNLKLGAYIVAANNDNTSFGSVALFDTSVNSLTIWGDDTGTQETDGAIEGEPYDLFLVNGTNLYDISPYQMNSYQNNGMYIYKEAASVKSLCSNGKVVYLEACTDSLAVNYVAAATTDNGSCIYEGCSYDVFYEYTEEVSIDNGTCENLIVYGCTDSLYVEYHPLATENDSSCVYSVERISDWEAIEIAHEELLLESFEMSSRLNPIPIDLYKGWNIIGYNLNYSQNTAACFDEISDHIVLAKDNNGTMYWPEFGWNGIGDLVPGQGYQIYMRGEVDDFSFVDIDGMRIEMQEKAPQWAHEIAPVHPNDKRTLVRVVNMLGQEVSTDNQEADTPLLYLYNDGSVEKRLSK